MDIVRVVAPSPLTKEKRRVGAWLHLARIVLCDVTLSLS